MAQGAGVAEGHEAHVVARLSGARDRPHDEEGDGQAQGQEAVGVRGAGSGAAHVGAGGAVAVGVGPRIRLPQPQGPGDPHRGGVRGDLSDLGLRGQLHHLHLQAALPRRQAGGPGDAEEAGAAGIALEPGPAPGGHVDLPFRLGGPLQGRGPQPGRRHARQLVRGPLEAARLVQGQGQQDDDAGHHDHPLHDVRPDNGVEAAVGRVEDDDGAEGEQAEEVLGIDPARVEPGAEVRRQAVKGADPVEEGLEDEAAGLELGHQVEGHEEHDEARGQQAEGGGVEAVAEDVGHGDGAGLARHLVQALADEAHHADGDHHVAADPQGQHPAVAVDLGGEAGEGAARGRGGGEGEGEGPHPQAAAAEEVLAEEPALAQQPVGDDGQDQDPGHVEEEGGQGAAGAHRGSSSGASPRSSSDITRRLNHRAKTEAAAHGTATPQNTHCGIPATVAVRAPSP